MPEPSAQIPPTEATEQNYVNEYVVVDSYDTIERRAINAPDADDVDAISDETIRKMKRDPAVISALEYLRMTIFGESPEFHSAVKPEDENGEMAESLRRFIQHALSGMATPLGNVLPQFAGAFETGFRVGELVYRLETEGEFAGLYVMDRIKVKPRRAVAFVVDRFWNVLGFLGVDRKRNFSAANGMPVLNPADVLPREKFLCWSVREEDGDPRGRSVLIAALDYWQRKAELPPKYNRYLGNTSQPPLVGIASDKHGAPQPDPRNPARTMGPPEAMARALIGLWDDGNHALGFPAGADVKSIPITQAHTAFPEAFDTYDRQITRAILLAVREMMEAKHGSRADSGTAENIGKKVVAFFRSSFCEAFRRDVIIPLVRYNFGDAAVAFAPRISLGDIDRIDWTTHAQAAAQLGYQLHPTQFPALDEKLGVGVRDREAVDEYDEHQMERMARRNNTMLDPMAEDDADDTEDE